MIKTYYLLTKPGIIYGNAFTALGGFFLAAKGNVNFLLLLAMLFGLSFVVASACVFNNYIDQGIDAKMLRTKKRALVRKIIPGSHAIIYGIILGVIGFSLLLFYTNLLTTFIAFVGYFFYIVLYGIEKRRSEYGTLVGSVSGAVPPVVGYCAVTNHFDIGALLLFFILMIWQMPHFYAIAIFRYEDYAKASIPVLPVTKGMHRTKIHMFFYLIFFLLAIYSLALFHYVGYSFLISMLFLGLLWLGLFFQGFKSADEKKWARKMFSFSLVIILVFSVMLSINSFLP